jgi:hypothetical protein
MNNHPDEVLRWIGESRGSACSLVVTYDPVLTFYLATHDVPREIVLTSSQNAFYPEPRGFSDKNCGEMEFYVVQS